MSTGLPCGIIICLKVRLQVSCNLAFQLLYVLLLSTPRFVRIVVLCMRTKFHQHDRCRLIVSLGNYDSENFKAQALLHTPHNTSIRDLEMRKKLSPLNGLETSSRETPETKSDLNDDNDTRTHV